MISFTILGNDLSCLFNLIICFNVFIYLLSFCHSVTFFFFFLISNCNLLKSAKGRNPYTREVYKRAPKRVE
jgi:cellulose synthase/poly-beta-1,6-N-acetylglucosamine synthase-like glycosyltransferase